MGQVEKYRSDYLAAGLTLGIRSSVGPVRSPRHQAFMAGGFAPCPLISTSRAVRSGTN